MTRSLDQALLQGADVSAMANTNLVVNGHMQISQENGSGAVTTGKWPVDQWLVGLGTANMAITGQQIGTPFPSQPDIPYAVKINVTTALATLGAADYIILQQPIEGTYLQKLMYGSAQARPVTVCFMARSSISLVGYFSFRSTATSRTFIQRFVLAANTDTFVSFVIPGDTISPIANNTNVGMYAAFVFGSGVNPQTTTVGAWAGSQGVAASDVTNLAAAVNNNVIVSGVTILPGIVPVTQQMLPLLARPYDDERMKCWRYYSIQASETRFYASAGNQFNETPIYFPAAMRTIPTATLFAAGGQQGNAGGYPQVVVFSNQIARHTIYSAGAGDVYALNYTYAFSARM